jgi:excinuclease ABC subunit B
MERAIGETERRREKQIAHNLANGITPQSLNKPITDIMDVGDSTSHTGGVRLRKVAESKPTYQGMSSTELMAKISELEKQMFTHAKNLEFEQAASVRDEVEVLRALTIKQA